MNDVSGIRDETVVVTGGGGVLGATLAKALAGLGAKVAIWDVARNGRFGERGGMGPG